jgi:hypothetical protein
MLRVPPGIEQVGAAARPRLTVVRRRFGWHLKQVPSGALPALALYSRRSTNRPAAPDQRSPS